MEGFLKILWSAFPLYFGYGHQIYDSADIIEYKMDSTTKLDARILIAKRPHSIIVSNDGKSQRHVMKHGVFPLHNPTYRNILSWKGGGEENLLNTAQENNEMIKLTQSGVHP